MIYSYTDNMTSNRMRRIIKELGDIQKDSQSQILAEPAGTGDDLSLLKASFPGPPDTPYEGGTYVVDIKIPQEYPFRPPVMKFETKLWHPNVSSQTVCVIPQPLFIQQSFLRQLTLRKKGAICLDTLGTAWSPVLTIKSALLSLQSLLSTPEPKDPQDAEVASMLMNHPEQFDRVAREWAVKYAEAPKTLLTAGGTSYTHSAVSKPKTQKTREQELREEIARYDSQAKDGMRRTHYSIGIKVTTRTSLIAS
jgi:ubiquitin-conjugating enzyme (huntingtin interacting protein 2)